MENINDERITSRIIHHKELSKKAKVLVLAQMIDPSLVASRKKKLRLKGNLNALSSRDMPAKRLYNQEQLIAVDHEATKD